MKNYFNTNLKYIREKMKLSQTKLADMLKVNQTTIARWEDENRVPSIDKVIEVANFFNISIGDLTGIDLTIKNVLPIELDEEVTKIPVLGRIPAGIPFEAIEDVIKYIDIPKEWTCGNKEYFGLLIDGNSMFPKYQNEDIVIFQKCEDHIKCNNKDCAVMVNGNDATFKKFIFNNNAVILQPYNSEYEIKSYSPNEVEELPIKVLGYAVQIRRDL